jgi:hypothetical protein
MTGWNYAIACSNCEAKSMGFTTFKEACKEWNTRHVPQGYALIELKSVLTPKGEPMPQTIDAWQYLASKYDDGMLEQKEEIAKLKSQVNNLRQKLKAKEGYALVPIEPAEILIKAMHREIDWCRDDQNTYHLEHESQIEGSGTSCKEDLIDAYKAMIAAAQEQK